MFQHLLAWRVLLYTVTPVEAVVFAVFRRDGSLPGSIACAVHQAELERVGITPVIPTVGQFCYCFRWTSNTPGKPTTEFSSSHVPPFVSV